MSSVSVTRRDFATCLAGKTLTGLMNVHELDLSVGRQCEIRHGLPNIRHAIYLLHVGI
ncbi:hypothetical protein [Shimia thalassica]|uniref:hypothetical protein n=1 Tax=Shimia thalassica TaxID=1715693 RepID=UPI0026E1EE0C|nr:hypothetical protein [Shimia thalassica]MDO6478472.1 hypothetical protein [Shimia thalassica]